MAVGVRLAGRIGVLRPEGRLASGAGDTSFRDALQRALGAGAVDVLVELEAVAMLDSAGLGVLMAGYTTLHHRGGRIRLLHVPPRCHDILQLTRLLTVFEVFDDEGAALASFG